MYIDYMHYYSDYSTATRLPDRYQDKKQSNFIIERRTVVKDVFSQQNTSQGAQLYKFNGQMINSTGITDGFRSHAFGIYLLDMKAKLRNNE